MIAELAEVRGRSARWRFALSSARATLWLPPAGGWPVLALVTGVVVASVAAVGPAVGAAVPGLTVFAVTFTGLVGAMVVLAVARSRRPRLPVPAPTVLVVGGVAASIAVTVIFLRREPAAARHLPPAAGGVSRRRTGRLPVDRRGIPAVAGHQPARPPPRRRRRCRVRGLVPAGVPAPTGRSPRSRSCSCSAPCSCSHRSPPSSSRRSRRAGRPVVPLGPAGRRLDRDRHDAAHLRPLAARGAAPSRDRRPDARRRTGGARRREPGRCLDLLPRHLPRARPHARGGRRRPRRPARPPPVADEHSTGLAAARIAAASHVQDRTPVAA